MTNTNKDLCPECRVNFAAPERPEKPETPRTAKSAGPPDVNDLCPVCGLKFTSSCRCRRGNKWCKNGHAWHRCKVHNVRVLGTGHGSNLPHDACCCPKHSTESPGRAAGPAEMSGSVSFVFDLDDPVVKFD
jgi:hypothetical protein